MIYVPNGNSSDANKNQRKKTVIITNSFFAYKYLGAVNLQQQNYIRINKVIRMYEHTTRICNQATNNTFNHDNNCCLI